ncbi:MAG: trmD [Deltaproteobacteria bacterium]|nr:trmD [Deltaproteobacteria bacterium]
MKFHILTLFPEMFAGFLSSSIIGRAVENGMLEVELHNIRDYAVDRHKTVDDAPYGGGAGMVMKVEPLARAIDSVKSLAPEARLLLSSPRGVRFSQQLAAQFAAGGDVIIVCGRYEGIDERVAELYGAEEISLGDFVMTGGELAAMAIIDTVGRLLPGVLGCEDSAADDSFTAGLLEYPQYTRPPEFRGLHVPEVLLSGNHAAIAKWRRKQSLQRTRDVRPDLFSKAAVPEREAAALDQPEKAAR